jgi:hypothetical protein
MRLKSMIVAAPLLLYCAASWGEVAVLKYSKIGTSVTGKPVLNCSYLFRNKTIKRQIPAKEGKCPPMIEIY